MTRSSKQERAYQKRRQESWDKRSREKAARRRRTTMVVATIVGLAVVAAVIALLLINRPDAEEPEAQPTDTATTAPTEAPAALPTTDPELYDAAPDPAEAEGRTWDVTIQTSAGDIAMEIDGENAPQAAANFLRLARDGFYDGTACHRLLPDSLLQCGDPTATGTGGPGYSFGPVENAPEDDVYPAGTLAMARQSNNAESMGSQFFMVFADVPLPSDTAGGYSVFGRVTEGLDILQQVGSAGTVEGTEQPALPVTIEGVTID
ncbi:peptidylprolyl isomerase [Oceanitalea stevensii]|uniref:Peptidyl-prolyl cis-trans isomerase n=1 Tax=Oceanitalea stevensii TaxID=2763072 RepID=A0ABR8YYT3_9MICO|nr:peptidylprolyl isomerase [Oceanitalea stevensii]MBD8061242.1 peptidylprolyl isomerase [Oceanitalea stevensii]